MGECRHKRGFTLIEAMIVVAVVGVLAVLALVAYRRWVQSSYVAEAQDMVSSIRTSEESFFAENGGYLDVSGCLGVNCTYPLQKPGSSKTAWGGPCGWCTNPTTGWGALNVHPSAPLIFGYAVIADKLLPMSTRVGAIKVNGQLIDVTSAPAGAPWYFVEADANVSGDSSHYMHVYGMAGNNQIWVDQEGN